nr:uncharacterized protein LOC128698931 isoform X2 [Cherax quadricarinatus]
MNLPVMRRGLSPEGRKIRERHQGTLTIGIQGTTVQPTERDRTHHNFLQDNVRRLHEIQARCKERDNHKRSQPLKATRESSASTSSSVRQGSALVPVRNGSAKLVRCQNSERGGSAHSDYFSLTEEQIEPLITQPSQRYLSEHSGLVSSDNNAISDSKCSGENILNYPKNLNQDNQILLKNSHISNSQQRSRSGSPVILKPITSKLVQTMPTSVVPTLKQTSGTDQMFLIESELTQGMKKMRLDNLMSKIKSQKPSCELDYNLHYKTIEHQHKMLLDSSDRLSSYRNYDGSARNEIDTQRSGIKLKTPVVSSRPTSSKMTRAQSFDRDLLNKKNGNMIPKSNKPNSNLKNNKKNSPHPSSPHLRKRLSKSNSNLAHSNSSLFSQSSNQDQSGGITVDRRKVILSQRTTPSPSSPTKNDTAKVEAVQSSRSSPVKSSGDGDDRNIQESSLPSHTQIDFSDYYSDDKLQYGDAGEVSFDRTDSVGDINLCTAVSSCDRDTDNQFQSALHEPKSEKLHLNIRPESTGSLVNQNIDNRILTDDLRLNTCDTHFDDLDFIQDLSKDSPKIIQNENKDSHEDEDIKTSTPVPNSLHDIPLCSSSPKLLKRQEHEVHGTRKSTLRRSQSLKNVHHRPGDLHHHPGDPPPTYKKGKVPKYLLARKEEEKRLKELALAVDPDCPPGHTPLPDHERRNTLHLLKKSQTEVMRELSTLPVAQDTLRLKKLRHDLEAKLTQIEDGLRIFSQPQVYVMNDE